MDSEFTDIPLDFRFLCPHFWEPETVCRFYRQTHSVLYNRTLPDMHDFIQTLNKQVVENFIFETESSTWQDDIDSEQLEILLTHFPRQQGLSVTQVNSKRPRLMKHANQIMSTFTGLIKTIRDKDVHSPDVPTDLHSVLGWYTTKGTLDYHLYAKYWIQKFPKLLPFLWKRMLKFSDHPQLHEFYPLSIRSYVNSSPDNVSSLLEQIKVSLVQNLNSGGLLCRYSKTQDSYTILEFRKISLLISADLVIHVEIHENQVVISWTDISKNCVKSISYELSIAENRMEKSSQYTIITTNNVENISENFLDSLKICNKVIICSPNTQTESSDKILRKYACNLQIPLDELNSFPVTWGELCETTQQIVINERQVFVQGKLVHLHSFLPDNADVARNFLSKLSGEFLNLLLSDKKPEVISKHKLPKVVPDYFQREFSNASSEPEEVQKISEMKLVQTFCNKQNLRRLVFISGVAGIGKSQTLASLASKLKSSVSNRIIICMEAIDFLDGIHKTMKISYPHREPELAQIIGTMTNLLCFSNFEEDLVSQILGVSSSTEIKIELMIDALDELGLWNAQLLKLVIKMIHEHMPSVRVWATFRDNMLANMTSWFKYSGYKLEPLSKNNQINLVVKHITDNLDDDEDKPPCNVRLRNRIRGYLRRFSNNKREITGVPLICKLLAQQFHYHFESLPVSWASNISFANIFDAAICNRITDYLKRKFNSKEIEIQNPIALMILSTAERVHAYLAIKLLFGDNFAEQFKKQLLVTSDYHKDFKVVVDIGIVESIDPVKFIHRMFAEYCVAHFVNKVLAKEYLHMRIDDEHFQNILWNEVLAIEENNSDDLHFGSFKNPLICQLFSSMWTRQNLGKCAFGKQEVKWYFGNLEDHKVFYKRLPVLAAAVKAECAGIVGFLMISSEYERRIFNTALECQKYNLARIFIKHYPNLASDRWENIQQSDSNKFGILHWVILGLCKYGPIRSLEVVKDFIQMVVRTNTCVLEFRDVNGLTSRELLDSNKKNSPHLGVLKEVSKFLDTELNIE